MSGKLSVFFEIIYALVSIDATAVKSIVRASFGIKHRAVRWSYRSDKRKQVGGFGFLGSVGRGHTYASEIRRPCKARGRGIVAVESHGAESATKRRQISEHSRAAICGRKTDISFYILRVIGERRI